APRASCCPADEGRAGCAWGGLATALPSRALRATDAGGPAPGPSSMQLLLIRHAPAEPRLEDGGTQPDDGLRALTPKGRRRMRRAARGLLVAQPTVDLVATSPLVRTTQTAEIVAEAYDAMPLVSA